MKKLSCVLVLLLFLSGFLQSCSGGGEGTIQSGDTIGVWDSSTWDNSTWGP